MKRTRWARILPCVAAAACLFLLATSLPAAENPEKPAAGEAEREAAARAALKLQDVPGRIVYETFRDDNWELFSVKPDGSDPVNLTKTPRANELYPHVSPDGTKVCFVVNEMAEGASEPTVRNAYYMNLDGSGRTKVAASAREACWSPDGKRIAYLKDEFDRFVHEDFATKGIGIYDLATGWRTDHPNKDLFHLYNLCWSPDGNWFVATVHAGMGYKHAILAVEAAGTKVFDLEIPGCRPDFSPDGRKIAWGASDWDLYIGDLDLASAKPKVTHGRAVVRSAKPMKIYHVDWSPDGKYVAFSRGPERKSLGQAPEIIGIKARDWNIGVADSSGESVWLAITSDGNCNKEPDWAPVPQKGSQ